MANVRRLRQREGLTYKDLSLRLEELGRPIPVLGLSRLERGERRVDADDLTALAIAFGVTPNALMLPEMQFAADTATCQLTPQIGGRVRELWAWATGEVPLGTNAVSESDDEAARLYELSFVIGNRPHHFGFGAASHLQALGDPGLSEELRVSAPAALGTLLIAVFAAGVRTTEIRDLVETALGSAIGTRLDQFQPDVRESINALLKILESAGGKSGAGDAGQEPPR